MFLLSQKLSNPNSFESPKIVLPEKKNRTYEIILIFRELRFPLGKSHEIVGIIKNVKCKFIKALISLCSNRGQTSHRRTDVR